MVTDNWIVAVFVLMVLVFAATAPGFVSAENWVATAQYTTEYLLLALGETFVILTAGIDLSVGATLGLAGILGGTAVSLLTNGGQGGDVAVGMLGGLFVSLLTGTAVGVFNGLCITLLDITPFIVTLGSLGIVSGVTFLITNGADVTTLPFVTGSLGNHAYFGVLPLPVVVTLAVTVLSSLLLTHTRFGLRTYAIGSNSEAARRTGISVKRHLVAVYALCGLFAGLAGYLVMLRFVAASPIAGQNDELDAIAAVVIGGASLFGGRGKILGTTVGAFIIATLVSGLILLNVTAYWQTVLTGGIIILAVFVDQRRRARVP
ncbi:MAG: ABC transporter permease [Firmicutes bacterium]|nr:ABC transporter permease [Bacillota bacterium]